LPSFNTNNIQFFSQNSVCNRTKLPSSFKRYQREVALKRKHGTKYSKGDLPPCPQCESGEIDPDVQTEARNHETAMCKAFSTRMPTAHLCFKCRTDLVQSTKFRDRTLAFNNLFNKLPHLPPIVFIYKVFNLFELSEQFGLPTSFLRSRAPIVKIRIAYIPAFELSNKVPGVNVDGARIFEPFNTLVKGFPHRVIGNDDNDVSCEGTLIIFNLQNQKRFIYIANSPISDKDLVDHSKEIMHEISANEMSKRSGSAGSFMFSHSNSKSLSKVTQHPTAVTIPSVGGTAISTIYNNEHSTRASESHSVGRVVKHSVYRDVPNMSRVNKHKKGQDLKSSGAYRNNVIAEMMSRIESLIIAKEMNLLEMDDPFATLKSNNSKFERNDSLIAYACTTGEMRNYSALAAHVDGNKSHEVETLAYNGRVFPAEVRENHSLIVDDFCPAYLFCCYAGVVITVNVGRQIIHCNLKSILHVPDSSRNYTNYSRAYGPN
jgi:hypothetical protein